MGKKVEEVLGGSGQGSHWRVWAEECHHLTSTMKPSLWPFSQDWNMGRNREAAWELTSFRCELMVLRQSEGGKPDEKWVVPERSTGFPGNRIWGVKEDRSQVWMGFCCLQPKELSPDTGFLCSPRELEVLSSSWLPTGPKESLVRCSLRSHPGPHEELEVMTQPKNWVSEAVYIQKPRVRKNKRCEWEIQEIGHEPKSSSGFSTLSHTLSAAARPILCGWNFLVKAPDHTHQPLWPCWYGGSSTHLPSLWALQISQPP